MRLNNVQTQFKNLMLDHPDALNTPDDAFTEQFDHNNIPLPRRLKVYRNNIIGSLTDMIVATFPMIDNLVGREFLEGTARTFILQNPPTHGCLNQYGQGFDDFLRTFEPAQSLPYLPDMATFELAMNNAYYARDQTALTAQDLQNIAPESLPETTFTLADHVHMMRSDYPLRAIKDFIDNGSEGTLDINQGGDTVMISRPDLDTIITPLDDAEYEMMQAFQDGESLGNAVENTMTEHLDFDFQDFLSKHLELETFVFNKNESH